MNTPTPNDIIAALDNLDGEPWTYEERNAVLERLHVATPVMLAQIARFVTGLKSRPTSDAAIRTIVGITREKVPATVTHETPVERLLRRIEATYNAAGRRLTEPLRDEFRAKLEAHPEVHSLVDKACDVAIEREEPLGPAQLTDIVYINAPAPHTTAENYPRHEELIEFFSNAYELGEWDVPNRSERETLREQCSMRAETQREAYRLWKEATARTGKAYPVAAALIPYRPEFVIEKMQQVLRADGLQPRRAAVDDNDPFAGIADTFMELCRSTNRTKEVIP